MDRKRIAINVRFVLPGRLEGLGTFAYETTRRIIDAHPEIDFYLLYDTQPAQDLLTGPNVTSVVLFPPARRHFLWYCWFEFAVARWLRRHSPDLFLSPEGFGSLRSTIPQVIVVHDLAFEHFDDHVSRLSQQYYRHFTPKYVRHAARIGAVSAFSKADVVERYGADPDVIDIVYSGTKSTYRPVTAVERAAVQAKFARGKEYFLFVGAIHPRKNIARMLEAFDLFKARTGAEHLLVLAGRAGWNVEDVRLVHSHMRCKDDVIFLGFVPEQELPLLTAGSSALLFVSLFEGFGLPMVEAMKCDVPVIASNVSSMPEIAGTAAQLVDPYSVEEIAIAMQDVVTDPALRAALIDAGRERATAFSWERCAQLLWDVCERVLTKQEAVSA